MNHQRLWSVLLAPLIAAAQGACKQQDLPTRPAAVASVSDDPGQPCAAYVGEDLVGIWNRRVRRWGATRAPEDLPIEDPVWVGPMGDGRALVATGGERPGLHTLGPGLATVTLSEPAWLLPDLTQMAVATGSGAVWAASTPSTRSVSSFTQIPTGPGTSWRTVRLQRTSFRLISVLDDGEFLVRDFSPEILRFDAQGQLSTTPKLDPSQTLRDPVAPGPARDQTWLTTETTGADGQKTWGLSLVSWSNPATVVRRVSLSSRPVALTSDSDGLVALIHHRDPEHPDRTDQIVSLDSSGDLRFVLPVPTTSRHCMAIDATRVAVIGEAGPTVINRADGARQTWPQP